MRGRGERERERERDRERERGQERNEYKRHSLAVLKNYPGKPTILPVQVYQNICMNIRPIVYK